MTVLDLLDRVAIAHACEQYGVRRLRVFGSALTEHFDPARSDIDFLVDYEPEAERTFQALFGLRDELERITGRRVDLVDTRTIRNPYFADSAFSNSEDVYAA